MGVVWHEWLEFVSYYGSDIPLKCTVTCNLSEGNYKQFEAWLGPVSRFCALCQCNSTVWVENFFTVIFCQGSNFQALISSNPNSVHIPGCLGIC